MTYHLRRKDLEIADVNILKKILKSTAYVTIALAMDNKPYLVSLSHGYDEKRNCIYFHCAGKGKRARGIYPNVMAEMLSLLKKRESRKIDVSKELSFIEKEFNDKLEKISAKLLAVEESVEKSSQKLLQMICKLGTAV